MTKEEVIARLAFKVEEMEKKLNSILNIVEDGDIGYADAMFRISNIISFSTDIDDL